MSGDGWTIDELAGHAAEALASAGVRAPNGRVSATPDRRAIRWYATIGLLDPPLRTRGRTARYGERHLLQLVAVKRRQAEGHLLAAIQAELAGATDATLRRAAGPLDLVGPSPDTGLREPEGAGRREFWRAAPAARQPEIRLAEVGQAEARQPTPGGVAGRPVPPVYPVALHPAATLILSGQPSPEDLVAVQVAARPLLDLLAARGLLPDAGAPDQPDPPDQPDQPDPPDSPARRSA